MRCKSIHRRKCSNSDGGDSNKNNSNSDNENYNINDDKSKNTDSEGEENDEAVDEATWRMTMKMIVEKNGQPMTLIITTK